MVPSLRTAGSKQPMGQSGAACNLGKDPSAGHVPLRAEQEPSDVPRGPHHSAVQAACTKGTGLGEGDGTGSTCAPAEGPVDTRAKGGVRVNSLATTAATAFTGLSGPARAPCARRCAQRCDTRMALKPCLRDHPHPPSGCGSVAAALSRTQGKRGRRVRCCAQLPAACQDTSPAATVKTLLAYSCMKKRKPAGLRATPRSMRTGVGLPVLLLFTCATGACPAPARKKGSVGVRGPRARSLFPAPPMCCPTSACAGSLQPAHRVPRHTAVHTTYVSMVARRQALRTPRPGTVVDAQSSALTGSADGLHYGGRARLLHAMGEASLQLLGLLVVNASKS